MILLCLLLLIIHINAAGIAVHLNIASRIKNQLPNSINSNLNVYYSGAFHPDAFYNCIGDLSLAAETAHWPPFLKASINYYNDEYISKGLTNNELKSFIYGIFTHQLTDISWHSLNSKQGLLELLTNVEFNGNNKLAHNYLDTIGDFITLHRLFENISIDYRNNLLDILHNDWQYPIDDIVNIYNLLNFNKIDKFNLKFCMDRGHSALRGEILTVLTEKNLKNRLNINLIESPLTVSILNNYFYGGIDEISHTLSNCLNELDNWFDMNDEIGNPWDICKPLFKEHSINDLENIKKFDKIDKIDNLKIKEKSILIDFSSSSGDIYLSAGIENSKFGTFFSIGNYLDELTLAVSAPFEEIEGSIYLIPLSEILSNQNTAIKQSNSLQIKSSTNITSTLSSNIHKFPNRFGDKMFTWSWNGYEYLIVSEPGTSRFKVFSSGNLITILKSDQTTNILGTNGKKQWNLLSEELYDSNNDGYPDIIIGSIYSDNLGPQSGTVMVLDGKKFWNKLNKYSFMNSFMDGFKIIQIESIILETFQIPNQLIQQNHYEHFGSSYAQSDNLIFIGINSIGSITVFNKKTYKFIGILNHDNDNLLLKDKFYNIERKNSKETGLYAYNSNTILTGKINDKEWLLIGSPGFSYNKIYHLSGIAFLYIIEPNNNIKLIKKIIPFNLNEKSDKSEFINSMFASNLKKITNSLILISSNGYDDGKGSLSLLNLNEILLDESNWDKGVIDAKIIVKGDKDIGFTDFGSTCIQSFNFNDKIFLAISLSDYFHDSFGNNNSFRSGAVLLKSI
mgnify:FL=1